MNTVEKTSLACVALMNAESHHQIDKFILLVV